MELEGILFLFLFRIYNVLFNRVVDILLIVWGSGGKVLYIKFEFFM